MCPKTCESCTRKIQDSGVLSLNFFHPALTSSEASVQNTEHLHRQATLCVLHVT